MTTDERLDELLLRWEEAAEAGQPLAAEDICRDHPELVRRLQERIDALREMDWLEGPPPRAVPGYRLVRRLGRGGFGEVWEAVGPDGLVALKFVPRADQSAALEWRALEALKEVRHPHLLAVFAAWQTEEHLVITMERAERTLLDCWLEAQRQGLTGIPREELLGYLGQAARGIDYLHSKGIQHRDIKPQNLLLVGGCLKVADFGLARVLAHSVTGHTGRLTLAYAAPEFFDGRTTRHSDQYSLAVTYCQLRGGRLPFEGTPAQMVAGHLNRPPDLTMLPAEERPAVARALAKRAGERWPTCTAFVEALQRGAAGPAGRRWPRLVLLTLFGVVALVPGQPLDDHRSAVRVFPRLVSPENVRCLAAGRLYGTFNREVVFTNGTGGPMLRDARTGTVLRRFPAAGGPCAALAPFSQSLGLTGHDDGRVILWDLEKGTEVRRFVGHTSSVSGVAFSPDGRQVLTGSCDQTLRLWDTQTGQEVHCLRGHQGIVMSVAFDWSGRQALSGSWDRTVRLWDLREGQPLRQFEGHLSRVLCVAFSADGRYALSGGLDRTVRLWDAATGQEVRRFEGHAGQVSAVGFWGHDRIYSAGDGTVRVWDVNSGRELASSPPQPSPVETAAPISLDGSEHFLFGTATHGVGLWQLPRR
jgi:hypothetical protein